MYPSKKTDNSRVKTSLRSCLVLREKNAFAVAFTLGDHRFFQGI